MVKQHQFPVKFGLKNLIIHLDNWSLGEKADWNPSDYFIDNFEEVTIYADNGEIELASWWVENDLSNPTIIFLHGLTSSKFSPDILLPMGMLNKSEFNLLAIDFQGSWRKYL